MSQMGSRRVRWMISMIADSFRIKDTIIDDYITQNEKNQKLIDEFLSLHGSKKLFVFYQVQDNQNMDEQSAEPTLFLTSQFIAYNQNFKNRGDEDKLKEKAIVFIRPNPSKAINLTEGNDSDILFGEISPNILTQLNYKMELVYQPLIQQLMDKDYKDNWGVCEEESIYEFNQLCIKFTTDLSESVKSVTSGKEIFTLDQAILEQKTTEQSKLQFYEQKFADWLTHINNMLNEDIEGNQKMVVGKEQDPGPQAELVYWKQRMQKITQWCEQLKSKDFNIVRNALFKHRGTHDQQRPRGDDNIQKLIMDYNRLDLLLTDKLNEAKDNVKYLTTLEKFIDPLYNGTPQQIIDTLPALMNAIKMIHTIARFYNTADKMTGLFMKITNQMINNCKKRIQEGAKKAGEKEKLRRQEEELKKGGEKQKKGASFDPKESIWYMEPLELIEELGWCLKLNQEYKDVYKQTKDKIAEMPKSKSFEFSETQIFGKFDLFCRRVLKLIEIFNTIQQFKSLAKHNLEGMDKLTKKFNQIIEDFKKKKHDLLDYQQNKFDRDYVEFNVEISHLDAELQNFIDNNFNRFRNIEYSLKLLQKFENTLKRDSLKHNLQSKYNAILHNYATELDTIQRVFTDQKNNPPIVRNMPPEAGKIIWARHLFQKITGPIHMFRENVINHSEIRKYYGSYNTLGKQLTVYEMWFYQNWCNEIERSKAALQATLIVRHEENKKLYVNFDVEIMQLIREAKCMDRVGIEIPESARIILLQEDKFKMYHNELLYVLKEYERIISKIKPINKSLLAPHVEDLELKLRPGMVTLTWTSMNIDSYLQHVHQGLHKLEQLIISVNDIIENRIENNLKNVSRVILVSLPENTKPFSLDEFVDMQEEYIKSKTGYLISKNIEIERAVDDLILTVQQYPLDDHVDPVLPEETKKIKRYYFWYLYQALLNATQNSLNIMKLRVCGKRETSASGEQQILKPFFEVFIDLRGNQIILSPSLEEIQKAINKAATAVLRCSKQLYNWEQKEKSDDKKASFYEMIAQDKEIVKVILLLTGSIQGTKNKVQDFLNNFSKYNWLWQDKIDEALKKFQESNPEIQDFEDHLKKFSKVEEEIEKIQLAHTIGAMLLKTDNLSGALKSCAGEWKKQWAMHLHKKAYEQLEYLSEQTKQFDQRLQKNVKDIDSLGYVMETLQTIRKKQAHIQMEFKPVFEMYILLEQYVPGMVSDKDELDQREQLYTNWIKLIDSSKEKQKELQSKQGFHLVKLKESVKKFKQDVIDFRKEYELNGPMVPGIKPKDAMERLRRFEDEYYVKDKFYNINKQGEDLFGLQNQQYPELEKTDAELKNLKKLYSLYSDVIEAISKWSEQLWSETTVDQLREMQEQIQKYGEQCIRLPKDLKEWEAYKDLKSRIEELKEVLPLIEELKKPSIRIRHWEAIKQVSGKDLQYQQEDSFYLQDLIEAKLLNWLDDIVDITDSADKQLKIEQSLNTIKSDWAEYQFEFSTWGKNRDYPCILNGMCVQEVQEKLEEDSMTLATLNAQRHVTPFKAEVESLIRIFSDVQETLDQWVKVQVLWTSLEAVFTGGDIARQMPMEAKKFQGIDKNWLKIMEKAVETKKIIQCCQNDILKDFLPDLQVNLEICQKSLEQYLEGKRKKFPRFYFVSNPELLKILSQGSEPTSIQEDFEKLFDAITQVTFDKNPEKKASNEKIIREIMEVRGNCKEIIPLSNYVKCEGNIESWLTKLERQMQESMKDIIQVACAQVLIKGDNELEEFVKNNFAQVSLIGIQIMWTQKMTEALMKTGKNERSALDQKKKEIDRMLQKLTAMCLEDIPSKLGRIKIETLVTIQVHQRDLTFELKCKDINDFEWQKQCRMYWKDDVENLIISITDWDCPYSYEYLGSKERLCVTPLTDRCYISCAQAMSMYYGGAPAGPAGTGKTETVKDLGRTLGVFVIVTNCSDQHRYKDMAKIFKGLVQSGLWGCFDEFNRIELEVLSVVAMQIEAITAAKKQHLEQFMFPEETIPIDLVPTVGYFITMNPGYAGRQELPENLKVLFRSVTMMVPDREIIIKVKLASVGYNEINVLSKKFNILYKLCEEQLSKQRHYDFGLRNILSVLRTAGNTKRQERNQEEEMLLMRSLRDMNLSKLVADDIPLFNSLLLDIFPRQTHVPKKEYKEVMNQVAKQFQLEQNRNLIPTENFILKITQLYETNAVRHGFMLIGPSGSGKSTIIKILTDSLGELGQPYKIQIINPKSITCEEMYGVKSEISDDWTPGIFSTIWSKSNSKSSKFITWIVCDGPVDTIWIESLNSVLDDNKILTLANGERIAMNENCKMVFEAENLNNASPATVSRCGQVYVSSTDLGYEPLLQGFIEARKRVRSEESAYLDNFLKKYFINLRIMQIIEKMCPFPAMNLSYSLKVQQTLNLINGILQPLVASNKTLSELDYEKVIVFCISWAIGGCFEVADRNQFHEFLQQKGAPLPPKTRENETIFDYYIHVSDRGSADWRIFEPREEDKKLPEKNIQFSQLLIATADSFRAELLLNFSLNQPKSNFCSKATLLIGTSGTAKTSSILMYSKQFSKLKELMLFKRINFSSATKPSTFQENIEAECDFKVGKDFAPPNNKLMTVFIDDMSMPEINKWGDQETLEIVRQLVDTGGFYMLDKTMRGTFKNIKNLQYIGAMNHPGGGRNDIPNRMKRQLFIFNMTLPLSVESIFGPIIKNTFKQRQYSQDFNKIVDSLPNATIKLWTKVKNSLLPTPTKFHYVFNMRELSRVFKGVLSIQREVIQKSQVNYNMKPELFLIGLWKHECERVFADKLLNNKDKDQVYSYIQEISIESFSQLESEIVERLSQEKNLFFCDFLREDVYNEEGYVEVEAPKVYEAIEDIEALRSRCNQLLELANNKTAKKMNLVLFDDAIRHLIRISRIMCQARSSGLLVGVGGSGKQSLTRLAADIGKHIVHQMVVTKNFQEKDLKDEIKILYDYAGHLGKQTTFLLTDAEIKKEEFLEYINMLLSTGEIPGLIAKDEKEAWLGDIRQDFNKERGSPNQDPPQSELFSYFIDRLRDNLHIMLCFSPAGQKFRERARKFPALFNECTIDWFLPWPEEALVSVATIFIQRFEKLDTKPETKIELQKHMGNVHLMVQSACEIYFQKMRRQVYVTPKSFLGYLDSYKSFYTIKYDELDQQESNYKLGLLKIEEATVSIQKLELVLKEEDAKLQEAKAKTDQIMQKLERETKKVKKKKEEVEIVTNNCKKQAEQIEQQKIEAENDLAQAMPALIRAQKAVDNLKQSDVVELKANKKPLPIIKYIIDFVCVFFQAKLAPIQIEQLEFKKEQKTVQFLKDSYEEFGAKVLSDTNFMNNLKNFEKDNINEETVELLEPYIMQQAEWFDIKRASNASVAAAGILDWALAIYDYHDKSKIVKPKQANLIVQQGLLKKAQQELALNQEELEKVEKLQADLKETFQKQVAEKKALEDQANRTKKKINTARTLISSLSDEKERWGIGANEIGDQKKKLVGNVSLATAFISYCGPFNSEFRNLLQIEYFFNDMRKKGIPTTPGLELTSFLVDEATVGEWNLQGLPKDELSVQNGIMVTNSLRFPLLIDPQGQGQNWIKNKYADFIDPDRSITNLSHPKFKDRFLKFCMENGKTLIIEGIENEVDPQMDPILEKQIEYRGKKNKFIKMGDTEIEYDSNFNLFLITRLPNPSFSPELSAKTTIINFTVTQGGLEQQLLGIVLSKEQRALEEQLQQLFQDVNKNKKDLQRLDKNLLFRLANSTGNLLDDTELMDVLNNTKTQAKEVKLKLIDADSKTKEINEKREQYRPIAVRGSALYFCMIELSQINWMYNSSLEQFLDLFDISLNESEKAQLPSKRVENVIKFLTYCVYKYVNRGLFEKDKTTFVLMISFKIMTTAQKIQNNDVSIFLKAGASLDVRSEKQKPIQYINDKQWMNVLALSRHCFANDQVPFFRELPELLQRNDQQWRAFVDHNAPENQTIPDFADRINGEKEIGGLLKLCLLRSLREDRTMIVANQFIEDCIGNEFTAPISYPIEDIYQESIQDEPIIFLLSSGADPTSTIDEFAKKKKKYPCDKVSMGEGQDRVARKVMAEAFINGSWIILQNCHLGLQFMAQILELLNPEQPINPEFRLWITCEPHNRFPLSLLQKSIKVTNEPPKGIKAGLHKTWTTIINQDFLDKIDHSVWRSLVFTICFLHSIVQERRKFGALGWCVPYEFNNSDLEASLCFIEKYLSNLMSGPSSMTQTIPVNTNVLKYMVCEVQYGGRITDDLDRELFAAYGDDYIKEGIFGADYVFIEISLDSGTGKEKFKYKIPNAQQNADIIKYRDYVDTVPQVDSPEVFGLHANADLTFRMKEATEMINTIMETRPKEGGMSGGKTIEDLVQEKAREMLQKMPNDYNMVDVREQIKKLGGPKNLSEKGFAIPLNIFLFQEIQRMQHIIYIVKKLLKDSIDAIDGQIIMTPDILNAIYSIGDAKVPNLWLYDATGAEISWLHPNLGGWSASLNDRNNQLSNWLKGTRPQTYWLTGFFNPQGFLTAMKQEVTRSHKPGREGARGAQQEAWSLDDVIYSTKVEKDQNYENIKDPQQDGVYINGLFLEGCKYKGELQDPEPKKLNTPLPLLYVTAILKKKSSDAERMSSTYSCPVYKYPRRTDKYLIFRVNLPCEGSPHKWKLRGVALLCQID